MIIAESDVAFIRKDVEPYVKRIAVIEQSEDLAVFAVQTLEHTELKIEFSSLGFRLVNSEHFYETINSLLAEFSEQFRNKFAEHLINKLESKAKRVKVVPIAIINHPLQYGGENSGQSGYIVLPFSVYIFLGVVGVNF